MKLYYLKTDAKKWIGIIGVIILAVILSWILLVWRGQEEKGNGEKPPTPPSRLADQRVEGFIWQELKDDRLSLEIIADLAEVYNQENIAVLKKITKPVETRTYDQKGKVTLFAREITYNLNTKDGQARGDVLVVADDGTTLRTQSLQWIAIQGKIKTRDPVTLDRQGLHLEGIGLEADTHLQKVNHIEHTTTTFQGGSTKFFPQRNQ